MTLRASRTGTPTSGSHRGVKPLAIGAIAVFLGYWLVKSPESLASVTQSGASWAWGMAQTVFGSLIDFLGRLSK